MVAVAVLVVAAIISKPITSELQTNKNKSRINLEGRFSNYTTSNIHQRMKNTAKCGRGPLQDDDESLAIKSLIGKIKQCNNTVDLVS